MKKRLVCLTSSPQVPWAVSLVRCTSGPWQSAWRWGYDIYPTWILAPSLANFPVHLSFRVGDFLRDPRDCTLTQVKASDI